MMEKPGVYNVTGNELCDLLYDGAVFELYSERTLRKGAAVLIINREKGRISLSPDDYSLIKDSGLDASKVIRSLFSVVVFREDEPLLANWPMELPMDTPPIQYRFT